MRRSRPSGCVPRRLNSQLFALLAPCHPGASIHENVNLFFREPLALKWVSCPGAWKHGAISRRLFLIKWWKDAVKAEGHCKILGWHWQILPVRVAQKGVSRRKIFEVVKFPFCSFGTRATSCPCHPRSFGHTFWNLQLMSLINTLGYVWIQNKWWHTFAGGILPIAMRPWPDDFCGSRRQPVWAYQ